MDLPQLESEIAKGFMQFYEFILKCFKDNGVNPNIEELKDGQVELVVKTVMQLQNSLISQSSKN